jgi:hypothetical protein
MSRAAILPFSGDPFLLHYWLYYFDNIWSGEIDRLYIHMNYRADDDIISYIRKLCSDRNIEFMYTDHMLQHGIAIDKILDIITEDIIMLIEEDAFIFKPGLVNYYFEQIEHGKYDIVGSKRTSCSPEIVDLTRAIYNAYDSGSEYDNGTNFWPCFFFCRKELLLKTDRHFHAKVWKNGDIIHQLNNYVVNKDLAGDTFVNTSIQIRSMVHNDRILYIRQDHGSPYDIKDAQYNRCIFDGNAVWTHVGSLSSGIFQAIMDNKNKTCDTINNPISSPEESLDEVQIFEFERRVQFWLAAFENRELGILIKFGEQYKQFIDRAISLYNLSIDRIRERQRIYREKLGMKC